MLRSNCSSDVVLTASLYGSRVRYSVFGPKPQPGAASSTRSVASPAQPAGLAHIFMAESRRDCARRRHYRPPTGEALTNFPKVRRGDQEKVLSSAEMLLSCSTAAIAASARAASFPSYQGPACVSGRTGTRLDVDKSRAVQF